MTGDLCPCGSGRSYATCCQPWHAGRPAPDAEALMRSRYCAFALNNEAYLLATWHARTRPLSLDLTSEPGLRWIGLQVLRHQQTGEASAVVEFVARSKLAGKARRMHEVSRFVREDGRWFYVDGEPG